jgi:hypothetical protein
MFALAGDSRPTALIKQNIITQYAHSRSFIMNMFLVIEGSVHTTQLVQSGTMVAECCRDAQPGMDNRCAVRHGWIAEVHLNCVAPV